MVQMKAPWDNGARGYVTEYYAWENYETWNHDFGYYGHRFNVVSVDEPGTGHGNNPLTLIMHGAGTNGYVEPNTSAGGNPNGVYIIPRDIQFKFTLVDPYTFSGRDYSRWFGYPKDGVAYDYAEQRCIRYIKRISADARYSVDTTRVYVTGGSMGGGGSMHIAYHHPDIFSAAAPSIGWVDGVSSNRGNFEKVYGTVADPVPVGDVSGPSWWDWIDMKWQANNRGNLNMPPIIHTFRKDDNIINQANYPAVLMAAEVNKLPYFSEWKNGGHNQFYYTSGNVGYFRFKKDEAIPAFANASNSVDFSNQEGQRNFDLDWSSSLHDLVAGSSDDTIVDSENLLKMTFKSLSSDATADITIRNAQNFICSVNENVSWENKDLSGGSTVASGTVTADANGLVTIENCDILTAGNTLVLTKAPNTTAINSKRNSGLFQLTAYPNPFSTSVEIKCSVGNWEWGIVNVKIAIYDVNGKLVYSQLSTPNSQLGWDASGHPNGIYIIKVRAGDFSRTVKVILTE
jgi:pimeloyl-ACP methyl ester carboxylesterase